MKSLWISKYALTDGVKAADWDGRVSAGGYVEPAGHSAWAMFKLGKDAHETEADARKEAEAMRLAKIASLKKQLAKLEAMACFRVGKKAAGRLLDGEQHDGFPGDTK